MCEIVVSGRMGGREVVGCFLGGRMAGVVEVEVEGIGKVWSCGCVYMFYPYNASVLSIFLCALIDD